MNYQETKAYSRGYYAGSRKAWPAYHPPRPPDEVTAEVISAAVSLANKVHEWAGMFGKEDEFSIEMQPLLDAVDKANEKITAWLQRPVPGKGDGQ